MVNNGAAEQGMSLSLDSIPGTSHLYADYVRGNDAAIHLFRHPPFSKEAVYEQAQELSKIDYVRNELADVLLRQNTRWGAENATLENCKRLGKENCLAVVTGQQAGLLGGPLYSVIKALHAVRLARYYEEELGTPVVPIFWLELEDHDLEEVNQVTIKDRENSLITFQLDLKADSDLVPINRIEIGKSLKKLLDGLKSSLPETEFTDDLLKQIEESYPAGGSLAEGFARFITSLLSRYGLILADPSHKFFKQRAAKVFAQEIENPISSRPKFNDQKEMLIRLNYHNQVRLPENRVSLYLLDNNEKLRIYKEGSVYTLNEPSEVISREDLLNVAESEPERLVPSVLLRPLVQDSLFPNLSYVAGPAEAAYFAQLTPIYREFEIPMPMIVPRNGVTLIGGSARRSIQKYNIEAQELFLPKKILLDHILREHVPNHAEQLFKWTRSEILQTIERLKTELDSGEGNFGRNVETTQEKIEYHLDKLQERYLRDLEQKHEVVVRRIEVLSATVFPREKLQERVSSIAEFINLYGPAVVNVMHDAIEPESPAHKIVQI